MHYRSVSDLNSAIATWREVLHGHFDIVVGVPRSGLLVANLVALHLNIPMTDFEGLLDGRMLSMGARSSGNQIALDDEHSYRVLVIDDSVYTGNQIRKIREQLDKANLRHEICLAAVYVLPGQESSVDLFRERVPSPRAFEWNLLYHPIIEESCFDIDGVLCRDPTDMENDDGERYVEFVNNADPFFIPASAVGWLVTNRLEKFRPQTEEWLDRHGVRYRELIMADYPDEAARRRAKETCQNKATAYKRTGARLFIESSLAQSVDIANLSQLPVFCMDTRQMIYPGRDPGSVTPLLRHRIAWRFRDLRRKLRMRLRINGVGSSQ